MISTLDALKMQLRQAIIQLDQADKSLDDARQYLCAECEGDFDETWHYFLR